MGFHVQLNGGTLPDGRGTVRVGTMLGRAIFEGNVLCSVSFFLVWDVYPFPLLRTIFTKEVAVFGVFLSKMGMFSWAVLDPV